MNFEQSMDYLANLTTAGVKLGLDGIRILLNEMGNPQKKLKFIHIAGTNGKGSVMAYLEQTLIHAGYRVGRYISPTLFCYEERIQVNRSYIARDDIARLLTMIADARERIAKRGDPQTTVFEIETVMSFLYYVEQGCDLVLLETGMGGRTDATNIVDTTILEIIASISYDHMEYLGNTLEEIAWNKAGIIKSGTKAVSADQSDSVKKVLQQEAQKQHASICFVDPDQIHDITYGIFRQQFSYKEFENIGIHLAGTYQMKNASLSLEAVEALRELGYAISDEDVHCGFSDTVWEGRFQCIHEKPMVIIDGAHNIDAAKVLMEAVDQYFAGKTIRYVFGMFADKEYETICQMTASRAEMIYTIETKNNIRALPSEKLAETVKEYNPKVEAVGDLKSALDQAIKASEPDDVILVFGSLSFLYEAKDYFVNT